MRALGAVLALLVAAGCPGPSRCKTDTLLVNLMREGASADGNTLRVEVSLDGGAAVITTLGVSAGQASGTIQIEFPSGYPAGSRATVKVVSLSGTTELGAQTGSITLGAGCDALDLAIGGGPPPPDMSGPDYCGMMPGFCGTHGTCSNGATAATCTCDTGYDGPRCNMCANGYQDNDGNGTCTPNCATAGLTCNGNGTCTDASGTVTCNCLPEFTGPNCDQCRPIPAKAIFLYNAGQNRTSDFPGRKPADARVTTALPAMLPSAATATYRARAFISMTGDAIANFPARYCVPTTIPIYGIQPNGTQTLLAPTWIDFMDTTIPVTIGAALGYQDFNYFWTGSTNLGAASGHDCSGWTNAGATMDASISNRSNVTTNWLNSLDNASCSSGYLLLGLTYCVANCP
jgi:hypothetical protein